MAETSDRDQECPSGYGPETSYQAPQEYYGTTEPPYDYRPPQSAAPRPLGEAMRDLPGQYYKILTRPGSMTFAEEMGKASWGIIWIQLICMTAAIAILTFLEIWIIALIVTNPSNTMTDMLGFADFIVLLEIIFIPIGFFAGTGISYLIARAFGGKGTYLAQCYAAMLIQFPISFLALIPFLSWASFIYAIILQIFALMAVHRVSGGKAALSYLIPLIAFAIVLIFIFFVSVVTSFSAS